MTPEEEGPWELHSEYLTTGGKEISATETCDPGPSMASDEGGQSEEEPEPQTCEYEVRKAKSRLSGSFITQL